MSLKSALLNATSYLPGPLGTLGQAANLVNTGLKIAPSVLPKSTALSPSTNFTSTVSAPKVSTPAFMQPKTPVATSASISAAYPRAAAPVAATPKDTYINTVAAPTAYSGSSYGAPSAGYSSGTPNTSGNTPTSGAPSTSGTPSGGGQYGSAAQAYIDSLKENPRVTDARKKYQDYIYNRDKASNTLETNPVAMAFIRGDQQALLKNTQLDAQRLLDQFQGEQSQQTEDRTSAKALYDIQSAQDKPIEVGSNLVKLNPATGQYETVYSGPTKLETSIADIGGRKVLINTQTGQQVADLGSSTDPNAKRGTQVVTIDGKQQLVDTQTGQIITTIGNATPTEAQQKDAGFATRVQQSGGTLDQLTQAIAGAAPGWYDAQQFLPNRLRSSEFQQFDQASRDFINAILRRESGAAISQSEFDNAYAQYLPKPGDSPEVLAQKKRNRDTQVSTLIQSSQGAYRDPNAALVKSVLSQAGDAGSKVNQLLQPSSPVAGQVRALQQTQKPSGGGYSPDEILQLLDAQYGDQTSFNSGANRPQRNNNPGNVKAGGVADRYAVGQDEQGHLIFPDEQSGRAALEADITAKVTGNSQAAQRKLGHQARTIAELNQVYAEDPNWKNNVARALGVPTNTPLAMIPQNRLVEAIIQAEGYYA